MLAPIPENNGAQQQQPPNIPVNIPAVKQAVSKTVGFVTVFSMGDFSNHLYHDDVLSFCEFGLMVLDLALRASVFSVSHSFVALPPHILIATFSTPFQCSFQDMLCESAHVSAFSVRPPASANPSPCTDSGGV